MSEERKKFRRESAESRQEALILATLELVASKEFKVPPCGELPSAPTSPKV